MGRDGVDQVVEVPDVLENPLASPLDLAHLADLGKLDTILGSKKHNGMPSSGSLVKKNPDLRVFKEEKRKRNRKPLVFVSPFKRLVLLKPFLTSLQKEENQTEEKEQGEGLCTVKEVRSEMEDIRLENIKKVFDQLTSNTPKRVEKKQIEEEEEEDMEEGEVDEDSDSEEEGDGDEEPYFKEDQPYREATEKLKGLRAGAQQRGGVRRTRDLGLSFSMTRWWRSRLSRRRSSVTTRWTSTSLARRPRLRREMGRGGRARRSQAVAGKSRDL